ncbi:MAG TPA: aquaporin [Gemmataceae bacterium]|nr:aquaporin [Gemmataceae bacterium]
MDTSPRTYLAELIGTFTLVFLGAGVVCTSKLAELSGQYQPYLVGIALTQGAILAAALTATLNVSGGYLNPAVTLTLWVYKRLAGGRAFGLVVAQVLGALLAGLLLRITFREDVLQEARLGTPHLFLPVFGGQPNEPPRLAMVLSGIGIELVLTFILTFAIFGTVIDPRAPRLGGLGVGLALTACVLVGFDLTGAAANPARWLGPVVWEATVRSEGAFHDHAVYWIGPTLGALLAGGLYTALILPPEGEGRPVPKK